MKRNKRLEIRVSEEELKRYKFCANECNMPLTDWVRNRLDENRSYAENAPALAKITANMQTNINKIYAGIDVEMQLDDLNKGVKQLWQFLKK